jgi:hypothetical protein
LNELLRDLPEILDLEGIRGKANIIKTRMECKEIEALLAGQRVSMDQLIIIPA